MFFLLLITSAFFLQCQSLEKQIRGEPEVDYPTYYVIPKTSFRCSDQLYMPGFYADPETRCQVFHYCYEHRQESFLCPMGSVFNQPILACDYWYSSNCSLAPSFYKVNAFKRDGNFLDEADDTLNSHSGSVFDKMADLYGADESPESSVLENDSIPSKNETSRDGNNTSSESVPEEDNKAEDYNKYNDPYNEHLDMVDEKRPEVVKYEIVGTDTINVHKGTEDDEFYEMDNVKDFIFSEDGMLHSSQEDIYKTSPIDMNFNGYAEITNQENPFYDLNIENDFQISDLEIQRRQLDMDSSYARRPSLRKPIILPEVQPEIVQLPVAKNRRRPIITTPTATRNQDSESSYETTVNPIIYNEESVSFSKEDLEGTTSGKFPLNKPNLDVNYKLNDPELYESQEETGDEISSQLHQMETSGVIYDYYNDKNNRNAYVISNTDEEISFNIFGSGSNELRFSEEGDKLEILTEDSIPSSENPVTAIYDESGFDEDAFLGSGSHIFSSHSSGGLSFSEDQDAEDLEITDAKTLPMNPSNALEGSGVPIHETDGLSASADEDNESIQFVLKGDFEGNEYGRESSFSSENLDELSLLENSEDDRIELDSDFGSGLNKFNNLHHESEFTDNSLDASEKMTPEIEEIDGSYYYVYSDPNDQNADENVDNAFAEDSDASSEEFIDNDGSRYVLQDSKTSDIEDDILDYGDSEHFENAQETSLYEFEAEDSPHVSEEQVAIDSETVEHLSTEDLKFLEIMSENSMPMLKNLFEVSGKSSSDAVNNEASRGENTSSDHITNGQIRDDSAILENAREFENPFANTSDIQNSLDMELLSNGPKIAEERSNLDQDEAVLPEQNFEVLVTQTETDHSSSLFTGDSEIVEAKSKQLSSKVSPIQSKNTLTTSDTEKDIKRISRGRRSSKNLRTFNPPKKDNLLSLHKDPFSEGPFTTIPSEVLQMKHSTLKPYFYNYGLTNNKFNPRTQKTSESSKLSKLASFGKRLLASKKAKLNTMKKYIDPYSNN